MALGSRVFALCMAISLTLQAYPIGMLFDARLGLDNFSWALGYSNAVVAVYAGTAAIVSVRNKTLPSWLSLVSVGTLGVFVLLTPWLISVPEELHSDLPRSLPLLLLRETLYLYVFVIAYFCLRTFRQWTVGEAHPTGQLRGSILIFAFSSVIVFALIRGIAAGFAYFEPSWVGPIIAHRISDGILVLSILAIALGLMPVALMRVPVRIRNYVEQHRTLFALEHLRKTLVEMTGEVPWAQPSLTARVFNVTFVLYCACIDILDRRMLLQTQSCDGTRAVSAQRTRMLELLENLPDNSNWIELVKHLRHVARQV